MAQQATERIAWAVATLELGGDEQILEIGCGHGVAVSLVCAQLTTGTITAVDRSQTMIDAARKRNQACLDAGKGVLRCTTLEAADFGTARFDKIFAIRVNFFIQQPAVQLPILKALLQPTGALYLFYDPPTATQLAPFVAQATAGLTTHGFTIQAVIAQELPSAQGVCLVAVPQ
jgi:cyclopropane fatty-acyl-phospholipid synthase-like methyltransferase